MWAELAAWDPMAGPGLGDNAVSQDNTHRGALGLSTNGAQGGGNGGMVQLGTDGGEVGPALGADQLLYQSDAADEGDRADLGGCRRSKNK